MYIYCFGHFKLIFDHMHESHSAGDPGTVFNLKSKLNGKVLMKRGTNLIVDASHSSVQF